MRRRGITDFRLCMIDLWSAGNFGTDAPGQRLCRALTWVRAHPGDNGYARPVEGVVAVVDLNAMTVVAVEDHRLVPLPKEDANYTPAAVGVLRVEREAARDPPARRAELRGERPRGALAEVALPDRLQLPRGARPPHDRLRGRRVPAARSAQGGAFGHGRPLRRPAPGYFHRNAFDAGEYGIGISANSLTLGCDCLGEIRYFDAVVAGIGGEPETIANAVCLHEEDAGVLWKHTDWRLDRSEVRRSRRLVVSFIATVGNYEYGFYWHFYQDGALELIVRMTGVISNGAVDGGPVPPWGELVAPGVYGPIHQHFFNVRLDPVIDGPRNSVYEVDTVADPPGPDNPHRNAFRTRPMLLAARESLAQRMVEPRAARFWRIVNASSRNRLGGPVGYRLMPGENVPPFAAPEASVSRRAGFMTRHLWVTRYDPAERYAAGDYPNQHPGGAGLPAYAAADRPLEDTELVIWYTFGAHHVVRPEDWPVMPAVSLGFMLKPDGFFDRSPGARRAAVSAAPRQPAARPTATDVTAGRRSGHRQSAHPARAWRAGPGFSRGVRRPLRQPAEATVPGRAPSAPSTRELPTPESRPSPASRFASSGFITREVTLGSIGAAPAHSAPEKWPRGIISPHAAASRLPS